MKTASTDLCGATSASAHGTADLETKARRLLFEQGRLADREAIAQQPFYPNSSTAHHVSTTKPAEKLRSYSLFWRTRLIAFRNSLDTTFS